MLNINQLDKANNMMSELHVWTLGTAISAVAKVSFNLRNYQYPKNFETVMKGFIRRFKDRYGRGDSAYIAFKSTYLITMTGNELVHTISEILHDIPQYLEWNNLDTGFFIDLDAFDQNVYYELRNYLIISRYFEMEDKNND